MRAVIDTNIWMSVLLTPREFSSAAARHLEARRFTPVFTPTTLMEFKDAFTINRMRRGIRVPLEPLNTLIELITLRGEEWPDPEIVPVSRDPDDDIFIALAVEAKADYLVTRDDDLKGDRNVRAHLEAAGVQVVTIREFVEILEQQEGEPTGPPPAND